MRAQRVQQSLLYVAISLFILAPSISLGKTVDNLKVVTQPNGDWDCPSTGGTCSIDYGDNCPPATTAPSGNQWIISGKLTSLMKNDGLGSGNVPISVAYFRFPPGSTVTTPAGVGIPSITADCSGVTTDASGNFSFLVSK